MTPQAVDPGTTTRAEAFALWMDAPNPMVTFFKTLDGAVGMNSGIFNNPFIIWGKYHRSLLKTTLTMSFQFHHTQMDGAHAGRFLELVQETILAISI